MLRSLRTLYRIGSLTLASLIAERRVRLEFGQDRGEEHAPKSWLRGFVALHWRGGANHSEAKDGRRKHVLRLWWRVPKFDGLLLNFGLYDPMAEGAATLDIDLPPLSVSVTYEGDFPGRPQRDADDRCLTLRLARDGWFSWRLWLHPNNREPRKEGGWRNKSGNVLDKLLGAEAAEEIKREEHALGIPLPDGVVVPCRVVEVVQHIGRPRWPWKRLHRYCNVRGSEAAYKLGLRDQSFWLEPGWQLPQVIGHIVEQVARDIGPGRFFWKTMPKHCGTCRGIGATTGCCTDCGGFGLRPIVEVLRPALIEACREETPEGNVQAFALLSRKAAVALRDAVDRILCEPLTSEDPAVADALLSCAICYLRLGRLGECAEVAGMALTRARQPAQTDAAQRLLSQLSRMPLPETPIWASTASPRVKVLVQPMPAGGVIAVPMWTIDTFAELMAADAEGAYNLKATWHKLEEYIADLEAAASRAGWVPGQPLAEYIERLRVDRNTATDSLDAALWFLNDALRISIPEGELGRPVREFNVKAGAFLQSQGRALCVRPTTSQ